MKHLIDTAEIPADKREVMSAPVQPRQCALEMCIRDRQHTAKRTIKSMEERGVHAA